MHKHLDKSQLFWNNGRTKQKENSSAIIQLLIFGERMDACMIPRTPCRQQSTEVGCYRGGVSRTVTLTTLKSLGELNKDLDVV